MLPAGVTVSSSRVECDWPVGLEPVIVKGNVPTAALSDTYMVTKPELVPPADVEIWLGPLPLKTAVTPGGPVNDNETAYSKLPKDVTNTCNVSADP